MSCTTSSTEKRARAHVAGAAADAIGAVVDAEIGQQDFQERNAAAVRRIGVADAGAGGGADAAVARIPFCPAGGRAGGVVFGGIRQNLELLKVFRAIGRAYVPYLFFLWHR